MFIDLTYVYKSYFDFFNLIIFFFSFGIFFKYLNFKISKFFIFFSLVIFLITSVLPTGNIIMHYLEKHTKMKVMPDKIDGIVILSGSIRVNLSHEYQDIQFNESSERIIKFIELSKKYPNSRKVYSGGDSKLDKKINQSMHAKEFLEKFDLKNIIYEDRSTNTFQNIKYTYELVKPKKGEVWVFISSAYHMKRVNEVLDYFDWKAHLLPVDYQLKKNIYDNINFKPFDNLRMFNKAFTEILSIIFYKLYYL